MNEAATTIFFDEEELPSSPNETIGLTMLDDLFDESDVETAMIDVDTSDVETFSIGKPQITMDHTALGRYNYENALGEGAYGTVWRAQDVDIGRSVAIKSYKFSGNVGQKLLRMETNIAGRIDHPGMPALYDVKKTDDGQFHYIMKYIEGETLEQVLHRLRSGDEKTIAHFGFEKRAEIILQVLRVLATAHKQNIVHRDIKAENIMIGPSGEAYLMDWGIAIDLKENSGKGQLAGSPRFMSPEQASQNELDARSDLYSLSAVLFELMSLRVHGPKTQDVKEILAALPNFKLKFTDLAPHPKYGGVPAPFQEVIRKGLENDPKNRFSSAEEMISSLEKAMSGAVSVGCPITLTLRVMTVIEKQLTDHPMRSSFGFMFGTAGIVSGLLYVGSLLG
jgi:serine/threonine-protein kinase